MTRRIRFEVELGPGCVLKYDGIVLLETIARFGSIRKAALHDGHSYRHAWCLLRALNRSFSEPVTRAAIGGPKGGGVALTPLGVELLGAFGTFRRQIDAIADTELATVASKARLASHSRSSGRSSRKRISASADL